MRVSGLHYLHPGIWPPVVVWHTRQGRGFRENAVLHLSTKPEGWGLMPPPPPIALVAWQLAQSRSEWHETHALRFRWASHA